MTDQNQVGMWLIYGLAFGFLFWATTNNIGLGIAMAICFSVAFKETEKAEKNNPSD